MFNITQALLDAVANRISTKPIAVIMPQAEQLIRSGKCPTCGNEYQPIKDGISLDELFISGMCQRCQDNIWDAPDDYYGEVGDDLSGEE